MAMFSALGLLLLCQLLTSSLAQVGDGLSSAQYCSATVVLNCASLINMSHLVFGIVQRYRGSAHVSPSLVHKCALR